MNEPTEDLPGTCSWCGQPCRATDGKGECCFLRPEEDPFRSPEAYARFMEGHGPRQGRKDPDEE